MTDDDIRDALIILKRRTLNVAPLEMTAEKHVALVELIIDSEALLRGFPTPRSRAEIVAEIEQALTLK